jgi:cyclopropane-fatty-acyl-phospholipid synthase
MNADSCQSPSMQTLSYDHHSELNTEHFPSQVKLILRMLRQLETGALRMTFPDGQSALFGDHRHAQPVGITLKNWKVCSAVLKSGDIGFAETFIDNDWHTDNLPGLIELFVHNREAVEAAVYGTWWGNLFYRVKHLLQRNSKSGSRKNIHAHYDIGNNFYELWLDPSMTYSSALFGAATDTSLEQAQNAKYRRVLRQLAVAPGARILEIGCGWGGFAETAARAGAAQVTGLTLSTEQLAFAQNRLEAAGLGHRADLKLRDYRDVNEQFDAIASIEMFEAVGEQYWPSYFECVARNLKAGGRACIQSIVIADPLFQRYRKGTDFIQQYIFPGGMLPSPSAFREQAQRQGLQVIDHFSFGLDYARTLQIWRDSFKAKIAQIKALQFDQRFLRTWEFYLAYCEAGFRAGSIDVVQFTLQKG